MNLLLSGFIASIIIIYISSFNWQRSVKLVFILVIFEGALRKWAIPQANQLLYFLKDFVLIGAYLKFFFISSEKPKLIADDQVIKILSYMVAFWCLFQAFNPSLGSPIIGFFGLKNYLLYIPLMWMLPALFSSQEELYQFLRSYLLWLIPVALLAIAQFFSPSDSFINVYANDGSTVAVFGGDSVDIVVRVTGTFSYIAGYSTYLGVCFSLLLPILTLRQPYPWQWFTLTEILLLAATSFMTGARGLVLAILLQLIGYFSIQFLTNISSFFYTTKRLIAPAIIATVTVFFGFRSAFISFWLRLTNNQDLAQRIFGNFTEHSYFFDFRGVDGYGTGATFQANPIIRAILNLPPGEPITVYNEGEMGRVALEIGPIGFFIWYGFKLFLIFAIWKVYFQLKQPFLKQLALSIFLFQAISFPSLLIFNHTANLFHWFFNSFIFLLPQLEYIANCQEDQDNLQDYGQATNFPNSSH